MSFNKISLDALRHQQEFFDSGKTRPLEYRLAQLQRLEGLLRTHEKKIETALHHDLKKPPLEVFLGETGYLLNELRYCQKNLARWMKPRRSKTGLLFAFSRAYFIHEPKGQVLIIAPWNYPVQLLLSPLIGALAAGNVAVLKPSELTPQTSGLLSQLLTDHFPQESVYVVEGDAAASTQLLEQKFDHIFFTGSPRVGKLVYEKAAPFLTPVTLELGGKSPCIVDASADLKVSARRIIWGKFFNTGQTCVAPDYLLVHSSIKEKLVSLLIETLREFYGPDPRLSPDYGRIVNRGHFDRLKSYLKEGRILHGGESNESDLFIAPTLIDQVSSGSTLMSEEIFGPLLPLIEYQSEREALEIIKKNPNPLALYVFTKNKGFENKFLTEVPFGGGCLNETLMHLGPEGLPFGGIGTSGIGNYHGQYSFETFSHKKSILKHSTWLDPRLRYPPYLGKLRWIKKLLRE